MYATYMWVLKKPYNSLELELYAVMSLLIWIYGFGEQYAGPLPEEQQVLFCFVLFFFSFCFFETASASNC